MAEDTNPLHSSHDTEQHEEPQEPLSLREIAERGPKAGSADGRRKPPRIEGGYLGDDKVLVPDEDGITWHSDFNEPTYRHERQAAEALQSQREESEERQYEEQKSEVEGFEHQWRDGVAKIGTAVSTDDEKARFANYNQQYAQLQQDAARQAALEQRGSAEVARLNAAGQHAAAMIVARQILAGREPLQQKHAELAGYAQQWQAHAVKKGQAAALMETMRVAPELANDDVRADFKRWLIKECGIPPKDIEAEREPQVVAQYFKRYKKDREEDYRQRAQRDVAKHRLNLRGIGSDRSSESARQSLKERGKVDDALNFLQLRRRERAMGL